MMRVFNSNAPLLEPYTYSIPDSLKYRAFTLSRLFKRNLKCEIDLGALKDNTELIKVTKALNSLGIGVVPYRCKYNNKDFMVSDREGFTFEPTKNVAYINNSVPARLVKFVALNLFILTIDNIENDILTTFNTLLSKEKPFVDFCNSPLNKKTLKDIMNNERAFLKHSIANFYCLNPDNEKIPAAFFNRIIYKNDKRVMQNLSPSQRKYLDILMSVVEMLVQAMWVQPSIW